MTGIATKGLIDRDMSGASRTYRNELRGLLEVLSVPPQSNEAILSLFDTVYRLGKVAAVLMTLGGRLGPEMTSLKHSISEFINSCDGLPLKGVKGDAALEIIRKGCASQLNRLRLAAELALKSMRSDPSPSGTRPRAKHVEPAGTRGGPH